MSRHAPKRKRAKAKRESPRADPCVPTPPEHAPSEIGFSNLPLHELFEQQAAAMLERADIDESRGRASWSP